MELSRHSYIDPYGYRCGVEMICDDVVVFNSTPGLCFDFKKHGIRIRRSKNYDYILRYAIKNEQLFLCGIETRLSFFSKGSHIFGVKAEASTADNWSIFSFDGIPVDYTGILHIGKNFDDRYWKHDEKETPVPFSPDVYRENGYMKIEEGKIIEKTLTIRDT